MHHLIDDFELLELEPTDDLKQVRQCYAQWAKQLKKSGDTETLSDVCAAYNRIHKYLMQLAAGEQTAQGIETTFQTIAFDDGGSSDSTLMAGDDLQNEQIDVQDTPEPVSLEVPFTDQEPIVLSLTGDDASAADPLNIDISAYQLQLDAIQQDLKSQHGIELDDVDYLLDDLLNQQAPPKTQANRPSEEDVLEQLRGLYESPAGRLDVARWRDLIGLISDHQLSESDKHDYRNLLQQFLGSRPYFDRLIMMDIQDRLYPEYPYDRREAFVDMFFTLDDPVAELFVDEYHRAQTWTLADDAFYAIVITPQLKPSDIDRAIVHGAATHALFTGQHDWDPDLYEALASDTQWENLPLLSLMWSGVLFAANQQQEAMQLAKILSGHSDIGVQQSAVMLQRLLRMSTSECPPEEWLLADSPYAIAVSACIRAHRQWFHTGWDEPDFYGFLDRNIDDAAQNRQLASAIGWFSEHMNNRFCLMAKDLEITRKETQARERHIAEENEALLQEAAQLRTEIAELPTAMLETQQSLTQHLMAGNETEICMTIRSSMSDDRFEGAQRQQLLTSILHMLAAQLFNGSLSWNEQFTILFSLLQMSEGLNVESCPDDLLEALAFVAISSEGDNADELLHMRIERHGVRDRARLRQKMLFYRNDFASAGTFQLDGDAPAEMWFYQGLSQAMLAQFDVAGECLAQIDADAFEFSFGQFELLMGLVSGYATMVPALEAFVPKLEDALAAK